MDVVSGSKKLNRDYEAMLPVEECKDFQEFKVFEADEVRIKQ